MVTWSLVEDACTIGFVILKSVPKLFGFKEALDSVPNTESSALGNKSIGITNPSIRYHLVNSNIINKKFAQ